MNLCYLDCLDDLIGYRGECGTPESSSCIMLNDLPGVKIKELNAGVDEEMQNAFDLLDSKINLAKMAVANDVVTSLSANQRTYSHIEGDIVGKYQDDMPVIALENGYYKGIKVQSFLSPYIEIFISSISLQVNTTGDRNVYVWNLITGKLLDTFVVTCVADEVSMVTVNKGYINNRQRMSLFIGYESTIGTYETMIGGSMGCKTCAPGSYGNRFVSFQGGKIGTATQKIQSNVQSLGTTSGLSITYGVNCAIEPFVCSIANLLSYPLMYKVAALIMQEMQYSKRLNSVVTVYRTDHKELHEYYESEYKRAMDNVLMNSVLTDSICFPCKPQVQVLTKVP